MQRRITEEVTPQTHRCNNSNIRKLTPIKQSVRCYILEDSIKN